jgi:hypothetical protein
MLFDLFAEEVGSMFMRVNSKCAQQTRPPLKGNEVP